jgi:hypothetical protein
MIDGFQFQRLSIEYMLWSTFEREECRWYNIIILLLLFWSLLRNKNKRNNATINSFLHCQRGDTQIQVISNRSNIPRWGLWGQSPPPIGHREAQSMLASEKTLQHRVVIDAILVGHWLYERSWRFCHLLLPSCAGLFSTQQRICARQEWWHHLDL